MCSRSYEWKNPIAIFRVETRSCENISYYFYTPYRFTSISHILDPISNIICQKSTKKCGSNWLVRISILTCWWCYQLFLWAKYPFWLGWLVVLFWKLYMQFTSIFREVSNLNMMVVSLSLFHGFHTLILSLHSDMLISARYYF